MIKISITDTQKPDQSSVVFANNLSSVLDATETVIDAIDYGTRQIDDLGDLLQATDERFLLSVNDSSLVELLGYNFFTKALEVHLTSGTYVYENVPANVFIEFINADSKGQFFNQRIKGKF